MNKETINQIKIGLGAQVLITYIFFVFLSAAMIILINILNGQWLGLYNTFLLIRCFDLVEMIIPNSPIHQLPSDPFDLLAVHLLVSHFYFSYGLFIYLKFKCGKSDMFSKNNLSPFLLAFGIPMTLVGIVLISRPTMLFIYCPTMLFRFGAYNAIGLVLQYAAFKNKNIKFLHGSVIIMVLMNIIGLATCLYSVIDEMIWRFFTPY